MALLVSSFGPKYQRKNLTISALEFEKWTNHKIKALYNVFNTLNSPYNNTAWAINDVLVDTYPFIILVDPHPFRVDHFISLKWCKSKRVWIDQDVIDSPQCIYQIL